MKKIFLAVFAVSSIVSNAQVTNYDFQKEGGLLSDITTYPDITVTNHTINDDEVLPAKIAIGFPFKFNGVVYDTVGICENGFIWFGTTTEGEMANITTPLSASYSSNVKGIVSAVGGDLHPHINTSLTTTIKSGTTGTSPMRELIIEWRNTSRFEAISDAKGEDTITFQIKLYEFMNRIEVAYGSFQLNPDVVTEVEVGLRGATVLDVNNRMTDATHGWANSLKGVLNTDACEMSKTTHPNFGDLYVWMNLNQVPNGTKEFNNANNVSVYPNPTAGRLYIGTEGKNIETITITNIAGLQLMKVNGQLNTSVLDLSDYKSGVYFYHITDSEGNNTATGKIMLTK